MKSLRLYVFVANAFVLLFVSGCIAPSILTPVQSSTSSSSTSSGTGSETATATPVISVTSPASNGSTVSYASRNSFAMSGSCTTSAGTVTLTSSPTGVSHTTACTASAWSLNANFGSVADGNVTITVSQTTNAVTGTATRIVYREASLCDDPAEQVALAPLGTGTASNPFIICTTAQLDNIDAGGASHADLGNANYYHYKLGNDLDFGGAEIIAIDHFHNDHFDGNGLSISNAVVKNAAWSVGLFSELTGASLIEDLRLIGFTATTNPVDLGGSTGLLVGAVGDSSVVRNVRVIGGSIAQATTRNTGGIIGSLNSGALINSHSTATISAPGASNSDRIGGLVGTAGERSVVLYSTNTGTVSGVSYVGGLAGDLGQGNIRWSYATGAVTSSEAGVGGLVGSMSNYGGIEDSFATGNVVSTGIVGQNFAGGLLGGAAPKSRVLRSFSTSNVTATNADNVGGLIGGSYNEGLVIKSSMASGIVSGREAVGGLMGAASGYIAQSYATGTVSGLQTVGGFLGGINGNLTAIDTYATGDVSASTNYAGGYMAGLSNNTLLLRSYARGAVSTIGANKGGFVPAASSNTVTTVRSFWNTGTSGILTDGANDGSGLTDVQSQSLSNYLGFGASQKWKIDTTISNYPVLTSQISSTALSVSVLLPAVDATKVGLSQRKGFVMAGSCFPHGAEVRVANSTATITASASCIRGAWMASLDLSSLSTDATVSFTVTATSGGSSVTATRTIARYMSECTSKGGTTTLAAQSGGGAGTVGDPYVICNRGQLDDIRNRLAGGSQYFILGDHIFVHGDFTAISNFTDDSFNGNGFTITGANFQNGAGPSGLFSVITGASSVTNLNLEACTLSSSSGLQAGMIAGDLQGTSIISDINIIGGSVTFDPGVTSSVGGAVGWVRSQHATLPSVKNVTSTAVVDSVNSEFAAGLVSNITTSGWVDNSSVLAIARSRAGFVGSIKAGKITNSTFEGVVLVPNLTDAGHGGFVGRLMDPTVNAGGTLTNAEFSDCSVAGRIQSSQNVNGVGGFVGSITLAAAAAVFTNIHSEMAVVSAGDHVGGLGGTVLGTVTNSSFEGLVEAGSASGFIASMESGSILRSYAAGMVRATANGGHGVGFTNGDNGTGPTTLTDVYSTAQVVADTNGKATGLIGRNFNAGSTITRGYASGALAGATSNYGVSENISLGTYTGAYWNLDSTGTAVGNHASALSLNDAAFQSLTSFTGFSGSGNWKMDTAIGPYPVLSWQ